MKLLLETKNVVEWSGFGGVTPRTTGCPKKNARLTSEAIISGFKAPIEKSKTCFENYMFLAFQ